MMKELHDYVIGILGGSGAMNEVYKKHKANGKKISKATALFTLFRAFVRGAIVTWGVLAIITHYISWISDWHVKAFLAIVVGQLSLLILNYIEISFTEIGRNFIKNLPKNMKMIFTYYFTKKK